MHIEKWIKNNNNKKQNKKQNKTKQNKETKI